MPIVTIFLGAFLLFLIQPLVGNTLLPVFGGTAAVWSICLATFQILLVGGYFYAHLLEGKRTSHWPLRIHGALLFCSACWLTLVAFKYRIVLSTFQNGSPVLGAMSVVLLLVAAPYVILSANSSLVQSLSGGHYKLYAISNIGSLVGLLAYPLLFELHLPLPVQWKVFAALSFAYAIAFVLTVLSCRPEGTETIRLSSNPTTTIPSHTHYAQYFLLSFVSCYLLNAISIHLCVDISPLPMLWAAILSIYLLTYVLAFTDRGARFAPWAGLVFAPLAGYGLWHAGLIGFAHFKGELVIGLTLLALGGWIVHSRLYRLRPSASHLTAYYLMIALGGAVGGAMCSFLMPILTNVIAEYPIAVAFALGVVVCDALDVLPRLASLNPQLAPLKNWRLSSNQQLIAFGALALFAGWGISRVGRAEGEVLARYRNFYGLGHVAHRTIPVSQGAPYTVNEFSCNGTTHGYQCARGDWKGNTPTVYYAEHAGGLPILNHPKFIRKEPLRVALCGMGIGTLAAYARTGDCYRFFEINPAVAKLAKDKRFFTFIGDSYGKIEIIVDDARKALEDERDRDEAKYDIEVVDVFTGDSIPAHMATREAFELYLDRLAPDGILAFHISNWHLDLIPMVKAAAREFGLKLEVLYCCPTRYSFDSTWAFFARKELPKMFHPKRHKRVNLDQVPDRPMMTDDFHTIIPYLQFTSLTSN